MADSQQQRNEKDPPPVTQIDKDCAYFVRDALFPLRRDWGSSSRTDSSGRHHHGMIHPALMALDRLRSTLINLRPESMSYSNVFPRGVLLVPRSEALDGGNSSSNNSNNSNAIEYNGQPDVDESKASVEVIPDLLTVRCERCNGNRFVPLSADAYTRVLHKPWKNPGDADKEHELVVCSDRILQNDYYQTMGDGMDGQRREDLPLRSMRIVEETLAREITKLVVNPDNTENTHNENNKGDSEGIQTPPPLSKLAFPTRDADNAQDSCVAFAKLELEAARAAECLLVHQTDKSFTGTVTETFLGSALFPKTAFRVLPSSLQQNFVGRCAYKVAMRNTREAAWLAEAAARSGGNRGGKAPPLRPRKCVKQAWADQKQRDPQ